MPAHLPACGAGWPGGPSCSGRGARSASNGRTAAPARSNTWSRPGQTLVDVEDLIALDGRGCGGGPAMARCQDRPGSARPWARVSAAVKGGHRPARSASAAGVLGLGASTSMRQISECLEFDETCPVLLDLVRPHLGDLQRTRLAETAFSGSSHLIWSAMAILFAVSHSMWSVSAVLSRCLIQPGPPQPSLGGCPFASGGRRACCRGRPARR
jgi:hypothetical protein